MTVREHLKFSAAIRYAKKSTRVIDDMVNRLIERLGLTSCADTYFGDAMTDGLSGGEKKRCCIGYELITNPSCLILDEPTSGLDSATALRITQLLKQEARRGMTLIATIHSPQNEILQNFDRLVLLSGGHTIYNGLVSEIPSFLSGLGY